MAHRSINLATVNRGLGFVATRFRMTPGRGVVNSVALDATATTRAPIFLGNSSISISSISNNNNVSNTNNHHHPTNRSYSSSAPSLKEYAPNPLDAFRDPVDRQTRMQETVGRQWSVAELRRKSFEDLHKLWFVLYKEKNMLLTEQQLSRRRQLIFPQPERFKKVQKSMGAIRQVLGERKREKVASHLERHREKELAKQMMAEAEENDDGIDYDSDDDDDNEDEKTKL